MKKVIKNILTNKERKKLIEDCQQFLYDSSQLNVICKDQTYYPGKQTLPNLHIKYQFKNISTYFCDIIKKESGLNLEVARKGCWINWTNGKKKDINWHTHTGDGDYAVVYYIKTFPFFSNGTLFKDGLIKAPQNSLLFFPAHILHSAPSSPLRFERYTLAMNLNIVR